MACLLLCILSDFLSEPFRCRFLLTLAEANLGIISCMGGHAATTLFIICTAGDIAIFYHYALSNFQRRTQYTENRPLCSIILYCNDERLSVDNMLIVIFITCLLHLCRLKPLLSN